jgi:hypothetical protein
MQEKMRIDVNPLLEKALTSKSDILVPAPNETDASALQCKKQLWQIVSLDEGM